VDATSISTHSDSFAGMTNTVDKSEDVLDALFQVQAITVQVMSAIIECLVNSGEVDPPPTNESVFCSDRIDNYHANRQRVRT